MRVAFFQRLFAHYQWGLVQELAEHGEHEYVFFGDIKDPLDSGIEPLSFDKRNRVNYQVVSTWQPLLQLAFQPAALRTALIEQYDTFIFEGAFQHPTTWIAMLAARSRGRRVLLYTHGWRKNDTSNAVRTIRLAFLRQADALLLYGFRAKRIGEALGILPERMHVVYNSMDYRHMGILRETIRQTRLGSLREQLFEDSQLPIVIYVGRLVASKHVDLLIEGCAKVVQQGQRLGLLIVGDGSEIESLRHQARRLGVPTHFAGAIYNEEELCTLISASNVLVVPGPLGLSAIHAMTYGTPVITDDDWSLHGPEVESIVPGQTGAFFQKGDSSSLAKVLIPFLRSKETCNLYRPHCITMVDRFYNPCLMRQVFDRAVSGKPADDNFCCEID